MRSTDDAHPSHRARIKSAFATNASGGGDHTDLVVVADRRHGVREEILRIVDLFRAKVVDVSPSTYTIEITGDEGKLTGFLDMLSPLGIKEIVRSGRIAIGRGNKSIN